MFPRFLFSMILVTAATRFELDVFLASVQTNTGWCSLLTGIGPVESALQVTDFLARSQQPFEVVINFGVAGAYIGNSAGAGLLDICLAEREVLGDLGICTGEQVIPLRLPALEIMDSFSLDSPELQRTASLLGTMDLSWYQGNFITVNGTSGTRRRGDALARQHDGLCENMEGAAVARVCRHFQLPLIELRCISNLVEDRNPDNWCLVEACQRCGQVVAAVVQALACPAA
nr:futalosine hydrolase [Desulfobulbus rhabdoformis]